MPGRMKARRPALVRTLVTLAAMQEYAEHHARLRAVMAHAGAMAEVAKRARALACQHQFGDDPMSTDERFIKRVLAWLWEHREQILQIVLAVAAAFLHV